MLRHRSLPESRSLLFWNHSREHIDLNRRRGLRHVPLYLWRARARFLNGSRGLILKEIDTYAIFPSGIALIRRQEGREKSIELGQHFLTSLGGQGHEFVAAHFGNRPVANHCALEENWLVTGTHKVVDEARRDVCDDTAHQLNSLNVRIGWPISARKAADSSAVQDFDRFRGHQLVEKRLAIGTGASNRD